MRQVVTIILLMCLINYSTVYSSTFEKELSGRNNNDQKKIKKPNPNLIKKSRRSGRLQDKNIYLSRVGAPEMIEEINSEEEYTIQFEFFEQPFNTTKKKKVYPPEHMTLETASNVLVMTIKSADNRCFLSEKVAAENVVDFVEQVKTYHSVGEPNYQILYDDYYIEEAKKTVFVHFFLRDKSKRYLMIYYPLQYCTSYRSKIIDGNKELAIKMDIALRELVSDVYNNKIYDDIIIRFSNEKEIFLSETGISGLNSFLFFDRAVYDEGPEYLWTSDLLLEDYLKKNIKCTTSNIDIIYFDSIPNPMRALEKFYKITNAQLFFVNFLYEVGPPDHKKFIFNKNVYHGRVWLTISKTAQSLIPSFTAVFNTQKISEFFEIEE